MANDVLEYDVPDSVVAALGMPKKEITFVTQAADGTLAQTKDGNTYIIIDGDDGPVVKLYVPAHPTVKLPIETYRRASGPDLPVTQPVAPEVALALEWRNRQLDEAAARDGVELPQPPKVSTDPLADASVRALVTDAGPAPEGEPGNANPADQPPDEPENPQPAEDVVETARNKQRAERTPKS